MFKRLLLFLLFAAPLQGFGTQFNLSDINEFKLQQRRACHRGPSEDQFRGRATPDPHNNPQLFLPSDFKYKSVVDMDQAGLSTASLSEAPWSGDYWPYFQGLLGNRIADTKFIALNTWKEKYDYISSNKASDIWATKDVKAINRLSVAEKYDLLISSQDFLLTNSMWQKGKDIFDKMGEVEKWMGLCHGWAATAIVNKRPQNKVQMTAYDGSTKLTFYPDEIKALTTYSWANAQYPTKFSGRRCQEKDPDKDEGDRFKNPECLDLNPATWHLVVVNQIGDMQESFIMDATYSYEVWNQPVFAYAANYFNPNTGLGGQKLMDSVVKVEDVKDDQFIKYRAKGTKYLLGVEMTVAYVAESLAVQRNNDTGQYDSYKYARYLYDLELDENYNIIGGEWYSEAHPDFIWKPMSEASANNFFDQYVEGQEISTKRSLSNRWQQVIKVAAQYGIIPNTLVDYILDQAQPKVMD